MIVYVNAFWFGFLIAIVTLLILTLILAYIKGRQDDRDDYQPDEEEFAQILKELTGKKFRVVEKNGYLVGEPITEDEEETDGKDDQ